MSPLMNLILLALFLVFAAWVSWKDIQSRKIPDRIVVPFFVIFLLFLVIGDRSNIMDALIGSVAGAAFMLMGHLFNPKGLGMGDVKLMAVLGLLVGWTGVAITLFISCFVGAFVLLVLVLLRKMSLKGTIPFGAVLAPVAFFTFAFDWQDKFWDFLISMV